MIIWLQKKGDLQYFILFLFFLRAISFMKLYHHKTQTGVFF